MTLAMPAPLSITRLSLLLGALMLAPVFSLSAQPVGRPSLLEIRKIGQEPQGWLELASVRRTGLIVEGWVFGVLPADMPVQGKTVSGLWMRFSVNCQTRWLTQTALAFVEADGTAMPALPSASATPKNGTEGTIEGNIVDAFCREPVAGSLRATSVVEAVGWTRQPASRPTIVLSPSTAPTPAPSAMSEAARQQCAANYEALSMIAGSRLIDIIMGAMAASQKPKLELAQSGYSARAKTTLGPTSDYTWLLGTAIGLQGPYDAAKDREDNAAKLSALRALQATAANCDRQLGLSGIELP
jgi:hypothetical protein